MHVRFYNIENILYFGVRDLDSFEKFIIRRNNIEVITMDDINNDFNRSIGRVLDFVKDDNLHLSFDVDSMDPTVIPSTSTPVKGGLSLEEGKSLLDVLLNKSNIYNVDIAELNLDIGNTKDKIKSLHNDKIDAIKKNQVFELAPEIFLQPGPAPILDGIDILIDYFKKFEQES